MGTNYYARKLPNQAEKEILKLAIDSNKEDTVKNLTDIYYEIRDAHHLTRKTIHLGKKTSGWKFLWNTNHFLQSEQTGDNGNSHNILQKTAYDLNKTSILEYLQQEGIIIFDEYGKQIPLSEFIKIAFSDEGLDEVSFYKDTHVQPKSWWSSGLTDQEQKLWKELGVSFSRSVTTEFISDGLRFSVFTDFA